MLDWGLGFTVAQLTQEKEEWAGYFALMNCSQTLLNPCPTGLEKRSISMPVGEVKDSTVRAGE